MLIDRHELADLFKPPTRGLNNEVRVTSVGKRAFRRAARDGEERSLERQAGNIGKYSVKAFRFDVLHYVKTHNYIGGLRPFGLPGYGGVKLAYFQRRTKDGERLFQHSLPASVIKKRYCAGLSDDERHCVGESCGPRSVVGLSFVQLVIELLVGLGNQFRHMSKLPRHIRVIQPEVTTS